MKKFFRHSRSGFTLVEIMIVLAIIGIIMTIGILPYNEYMAQARLSNSVDILSQEWVYAHKQVRNGLEITENDNGTEKKTHADIIFVFEKGKNSFKIFSTEFADINTNNEVQNVNIFCNNPNDGCNLLREVKLDERILIDGLFQKWDSTRLHEKIAYRFFQQNFSGKFYSEAGDISWKKIFLVLSRSQTPVTDVSRLPSTAKKIPLDTPLQ